MPLEYSPSSEESDEDKVVSCDFFDDNEVKQRTLEEQRRRLERAHTAAQKREEKEACYAIIRVVAYESKQKELAVRCTKQEVIDLDNN
jgi:hypothetical protein